VPPCHPYTNFFGIVIVSGSLALCFCFDLDKVFLQGATTPPLHQKFFWNCHYFREVDIMLLLRLSQGISSGCHNANPTPKTFFSEFVIIAGRGHNASAST